MNLRILKNRIIHSASKKNKIEEAIELLKEARSDIPPQESMDMTSAIMDLEDIKWRVSNADSISSES